MNVQEIIHVVQTFRDTWEQSQSEADGVVRNEDALYTLAGLDGALTILQRRNIFTAAGYPLREGVQDTSPAGVREGLLRIARDAGERAGEHRGTRRMNLWMAWGITGVLAGFMIGVVVNAQGWDRVLIPLLTLPAVVINWSYCMHMGRLAGKQAATLMDLREELLEDASKLGAMIEAEGSQDEPEGMDEEEGAE